MALGIVPDDVFEQEVDKFLNGTVVSLKDKARKEGDLVPDSLRKVIGDTALESGNAAAREIAEAFGVSKSAIAAYKKGATSCDSYNNPTKTLGAHIARTKERISKRAGRLAIRSLDSISDDKLANASAPELATIARSAAAIVKEMEPPVPVNPRETPTVQFVMYAPQMAKEEKYAVIDVVSNDE